MEVVFDREKCAPLDGCPVFSTMQPTRQKIVELLKEHGQVTVAELADAVGLTQMAVRHHLNVLYGEKLVVTSSVRRKNQPGRPQQLYTLTEAANQLFPEDYYHLASYIVDEIKATLGSNGLRKLLRRIAIRMTAQASLAHSSQSPEERLGQLVQLLSANGFTARWEATGDDYIVRLLTCPYRQVAQEHAEVCHLDMQVIKNTLKAEPIRETCIAYGDEQCMYRIHLPMQWAMGY
jgi:predicted ArsR family transcriptional regulator